MSDTPTTQAPEPTRYGVIYDEPIDAYHANRAVSKSKLDTIIDSTAALYFAKHVERSIEQEERDWAVLGNAAGCLILEGEEAYKARYAIEPYKAPSHPTDKMLAEHAAGKAKPDIAERCTYWAAWDKDNAGKTVIAEKTDRLCRIMLASVMAHPIAKALLSQGKPEVTFRIKGRYFDIQARTDWVCLTVHGGATPELVELLRAEGIEMEVGQPYVADLKTTVNMSDFTERQFWRSFSEDYHYHRQGPFYRSVIQDTPGAGDCIDHFFFISVEKKAPFACMVYLPEPDANKRGWDEVCFGLRRLTECVTNKAWPGLPGGVQRIGLGPWYKSPIDRKEGAYHA